MFRNKFKIITVLLIVFLVLSISYNRIVLPVIVDISQKYAVTAVNGEINSIYNDIVTSKKITQNDFAQNYSLGGTNYINTNTITVNSLCSEMAEQLSNHLNNIEDRKIKIPLGAFSANSLLSSLGPYMSISIDSMGQAKADYNSSFTSCGVNQVNYKLWIDVECEVSVVTPLIHKNMTVKRKIIVVDMIYNGGVPNAYVGINKKEAEVN